MKFIFGFCILLTLLTGQTVFAMQEVKIGAHPYPPYYDNQGRGITCDILKAAFLEVQLKAKCLVFPMNRGVDHLRKGRIDAYSPGKIFIPKSEHSDFKYINYFSTFPSIFFAKELNLKNLNQARGMTLAIIKESPYKQSYKDFGFKIVEADTPEQLFMMHKLKRVDLYEATIATAILYSVKNNIPYKDIRYFTWDRSFGSLAFNPKKPSTKEFYEKFNVGMDRIRANGKLVKILEEYYGKGNSPKSFDPKYPFNAKAQDLDFSTKIYYSFMKESLADSRN